jgi:hypothetical protein
MTKGNKGNQPERELEAEAEAKLLKLQFIYRVL